MDETTGRIAEILVQAEHAHTAISQKTGGADAEWPLFYAWWMLEWSDLPEVLGSKPTRSELILELMLADRDYRAQRPAAPWSEFYAARIAAAER